MDYMFSSSELHKLAQVAPSRIFRDSVGEFPVYSPAKVLNTLHVLVSYNVALYWEPVLNSYDFDYMVDFLN